MRVLVCGGRRYFDFERLFHVLDELHVKHKFTTLINGTAQGADQGGKLWAQSRNIPVLDFPADWNRYGRAAGHLRNTQMIMEGKPDLVVAFPGGPGTENMIQQALAAKIKVHVVAQ